MALPVSRALTRLEPQTGTAIVLHKGDILRIVAIEAQQVADIALFLQEGHEAFSPGRTIDYNERIDARIGDVLFSTESTALARVVEDTTGVHDMLLAPCSARMFERRGQFHHPSCHENLCRALRPFGILPQAVSATLNVFMDVRVDDRRDVRIYPPASREGDRFALEALEPLVVGVCACSSELTNAGACKSIGYIIDRRAAFPAERENT